MSVHTPTVKVLGYHDDGTPKLTFEPDGLEHLPAPHRALVGRMLVEALGVGEALTFERVSVVNRARCERWHPGFPDDGTWTVADWSNAMVGEVGEAAEALDELLALRMMNLLSARAGAVANTVKKVRRYETNQVGALDPPEDDLRRRLGAELADVFLYLDLLATKLGIDLAAAVAEKFNEVSARQGFPDRLPAVER